MCRLRLTASRNFLGYIVASSRDVRVRLSASVEHDLETDVRAVDAPSGTTRHRQA